MKNSAFSGAASVKNNRRLVRSVLSKPDIEVEELQNSSETESDISINFSQVFSNSPRSKNLKNDNDNYSYMTQPVSRKSSLRPPLSKKTKL